MEFKCPNGHENFYTYEFWRKHRSCPVCKSNKYFQMNDHAPKSKGFRILAFDQASGVSGWSVFDGQELIKFGKWDSETSGSTEKIAKTKAWVASMIAQWKPDLVVFEDLFLQKYDGGEQVVTFKKLAHLQGVLENYCYENGFIYKIAPIATWRNFSGIRGKTRTDRKRNAQLLVEKLYDIKVTQDEADAILIGRWAADDHKKNDIIWF